MGRYVDKTLIDGEKVLYEAHISRWTQWRLVGTGLLLWVGDALIYEQHVEIQAQWYLVLLVIGLVFWLVAYLKYRTTEIAITNKRIVVKRGIIRRMSREVNVARVQNVDIIQGLLGRLLDFGTLDIRCGGLGNPLEETPEISNPIECHRAVRTVLEAMRGRPRQDMDPDSAAVDMV